MKKIWLLTIIIVLVNVASAYEKRDLLQKAVNLEKLKACLVYGQKWVQFPSYSDRAGWEKLCAGKKEEIISKGEAALNYQWKVIKATDYIEFERSGSRRVMEDPFGSNNAALSSLVLAELAEGKGRFVDQIANGIWFYCEMTSWAISAAISGAQTEKTSLPSYKEDIIELTSGDLGSFFAWTYFLLKDEIDKIQPLICQRLRMNLQKRILDPYMNRSNFWWQAFDAKPTTMVNNWNPWCNFNVLTCFLLLENDPDKLASAVYRTMISVDQFINYNHTDGACEEGPTYWGLAAGKLFDYLELLNTVTGGEVSVFNQPIIRNMGEYITKSYIGNGWVVNFADASAKGGGDPTLILRYSKAVNSYVMQHFAAYLFVQNGKTVNYSVERDLYRSLKNLQYQTEITQITPELPHEKTTWYAETEFCYMRNPAGFFVAIKGGHNAESHNHNDIGTFSLYVDETPVLIDAGVGTYTRQTFSNERYSIWTMQSNYHNLPLINGIPQAPGAKYRSRNVKFDPGTNTFTLDIAGAYPSEASVEKWQRTYRLQDKKGLEIIDNFKLEQTLQPNQLNFLTWANIDISAPGKIYFEKNGVKICMDYDPELFTTSIESIPLSDKRLADVWGDKLVRLSLIAKKMQHSAKYHIKINRMGSSGPVNN